MRWVCAPSCEPQGTVRSDEAGWGGLDSAALDCVVLGRPSRETYWNTNTQGELEKQLVTLQCCVNKIWPNPSATWWCIPPVTNYKGTTFQRQVESIYYTFNMMFVLSSWHILYVNFQCIKQPLYWATYQNGHKVKSNIISRSCRLCSLRWLTALNLLLNDITRSLLCCGRGALLSTAVSTSGLLWTECSTVTWAQSGDLSSTHAQLSGPGEWCPCPGQHRWDEHEAHSRGAGSERSPCNSRGWYCRSLLLIDIPVIPLPGALELACDWRVVWTGVGFCAMDRWMHWIQLKS